MNNRLILIWGTFLVLLFAAAPHAHAQFAECDPLDRTQVFYFDQGLDYPSLESVCNYPPKPIPMNNCSLIGTAFVDYSDVTILTDGTIEALAVSEDLSKYSATADVQLRSTVTLPNGQVLPMGGFSQKGYVMGHTILPSASLVDSVIGTISSRHELNWPGCDGYGIIILTSLQFELAVSKHATNFADPSTNTVAAPDGAVNCELTPWCTPATTPPACNPTHTTQHPLIPFTSTTCRLYYNSLWLAERPDPSQPWVCYAIAPFTNAIGTSIPTLGVCTK